MIVSVASTNDDLACWKRWWWADDYGLTDPPEWGQFQVAASQSPGRRPTSSHLHTSGMDAPPKTLTTPVITPMIIMMITIMITRCWHKRHERTYRDFDHHDDCDYHPSCLALPFSICFNAQHFFFAKLPDLHWYMAAWQPIGDLESLNLFRCAIIS